MTGIIPFQTQDFAVRVVEIDGKPFFVGKDVAEALGYANPSDAISKHCKGVAKRYPLQTPGGIQDVRVISEPDMLRLIVSSTLPVAERFECWVFEDVLPSIRKTGGYAIADQAMVPQTLPAALRLAADMAERAAQAEQQRDLAIATKAEIGSRREATAMATASTAVREAVRLKDRLGFNTRNATIMAVEKATGRRFGAQGWRPLKKWCDAHAVDAESVPDARYGEVRAWPTDAWGEVYGIDLEDLFGADRRVA